MRFVVMESRAIKGMWSVFDDRTGWVWQGFTSRAKAEEFQQKAEGASEQELRQLRKWKPKDERGAN